MLPGLLRADDALHEVACQLEAATSASLIVAIEHQRRGHGRLLVREIERLVAAAGALTMTLGTSDTTGATSLSGVDLYDDTFKRLANIEARRPHAFAFWRRVGYHVVGVEPDAEGPGKPSIKLARRL